MSDIRNYFQSVQKSEESSVSFPSTSIPSNEESLNDSVPGPSRKMEVDSSPNDVKIDINVIIAHLTEKENDLLLGDLDSLWNEVKSKVLDDVLHKIRRPPWFNHNVELPLYDKEEKIFYCSPCHVKYSLTNIARHWIEKHLGLKIFCCKFCAHKTARDENVVYHMKRMHTTMATEDAVAQVKKECKNNPYVVSLESYLTEIKNMSDQIFPKVKKGWTPKSRIVDTVVPPLDLSTTSTLLALYTNNADLRKDWWGRLLLCLSTRFIPDSYKKKCEIVLAGSSADEDGYIYSLPSVVVESKQFQLTFGYGIKGVQKATNDSKRCLEAALRRSIDRTLTSCASNAQQAQKDGVRLLPELAGIICFFKAGDVPEGLENKTMGVDLKNVCRHICKHRGIAFSFNYFSVGKSTEEALTAINTGIDNYLTWLSIAYDQLLFSEVPSL